MGHTRSSLVFPAALLAATVALSGCSVLGREPDSFDRAVAAYDSGNLPRAVEEFQRWTAAHPEDALGWFNLGRALQDLEKYLDAQAAYFRALNVAPDDARAMVNLAAVQDAQGEHDGAELNLLNAVTTEKTRAYPIVALAWHFERWGKAGASKEARVRSLEPSEIDGLYLRALAREPQNPLANYRYGIFLAANKRYADALKHFDIAAAAQPGDRLAPVAAGDAAAAINDHSAAAHRYEDAILLGLRDIRVLIALADQRIALNQHQAAVEALWLARDEGDGLTDPLRAAISQKLAACYAKLLAAESAAHPDPAHPKK